MILDAKQLLKMKADIEAGKLQHAKMEGALATLMQRLQAEYSCSTYMDAVQLRDSLFKEIQQVETLLHSDCAALTERLNDRG